MPRIEKKLKVFIASPSDLNDERQFIGDICTELNSVWGDLLGISLKPIKWETDIYPGVSKYSQDVINKQIDSDFDIFIAMFWNRFGTPTQKAESGTLEELNFAFSKYKEDDNSVDIMVYFKNQNIEYNDKKQQLKVLKLKKDLQGRDDIGVLYWEFENTEDFKSLIRIHLSRVAQKWVKKYNLRENNQENIFFETNKTKLKLHEYLEIAISRSEIITRLISNILESRKYFNEESKKFIEKFKRISNNESLDREFELNKAVDIFTITMDDTARDIGAQLKSIEDIRHKLFEVLSKVLSIKLIVEQNRKEYMELKTSLEGLYNSNLDSIEDIQNDINRWENIPDITNQFSISKSNMLLSLEKYKQHSSIVTILSEELLKSMSDIEY